MNGTGLTVQEQPRTAVDLRTQVNAIQQAMASVMKLDTHYGKVPGTDKNTLFKAGSEVLLTMFHIAVDPEVVDLSDGDHVRFRVRCVGRHQATGIVVGTGVGEASTAEEKYAWRRAVCTEEFQATDPSRRRIKWGTWNGKVTQTEQVRTNPADLANTVLKMAKKRAQIDLTLTATAASDIFTQDVEDLPAELVGQVAGEGRPPVPPPAARSDSAPRRGRPPGSAAASARTPPPDDTAASAGQVAFLRKQLAAEGGKGEAAALAHFQITSLDAITLGQWKAIKTWAATSADAAQTEPGAAG